MPAELSAARARAIASHREVWSEPDFLVRAPGRVNIIGEHTDYNDGFVFPMAIPFDTVIAVSAAVDGATVVRSEGFGEVTLGADGPSWADHMQGVQRELAADGIVAPAWRGTVATDIPTGASLSSSAALEVAVAMVINHVAGANLDGVAIAKIGQRVETEMMGQPTGIMDQLISATAVEGAASLIDCRSLDTTASPIPPGASVVVMDTMTRRELVDSEFPARLASCMRAGELLGVPALRDADDASALAEDHPLEWRRARHVIAENARTTEAFEAMGTGDAVRLGTLMAQSHESLRDLYEVSGPALDQMVDIAGSTAGCLGARMTGGGFAGCAVALVESGQVDAFINSVKAEYLARSGVEARFWDCKPAAGASVEVLRPMGETR